MLTVQMSCQPWSDEICHLGAGAANSAAVEEAAMYAIRHWQAATGLADLGMANETLAFAGTAYLLMPDLAPFLNSGIF